MGKTPESWKKPSAGEELIDYVLYDGQLSTTGANAALVFFDNTEAGVGIDQSNMPIASSLPSKWQFLIEKFAVHFNDVVASADVENILDRASFLLLINNRRMFSAPLREVMSEKTVIPSGVTQDEQYFMGKTYELMNYIHLKGGDQFSVEIETGETAPGVSTELTVCLIGELIRPL